MKKFMKTLCCLAILTTSSYAQTHHAVYNYHFTDNEPLDLPNDQIIYPNDLVKNNPVHLFFDHQHSYYISENNLNGNKNLSDIVASTYYPIFYYADMDKFHYNYLFNNTELVVAIDDLTVQWEITDETQVIDGYHCVKTIGKSKKLYAKSNDYHTYEAWFSPELPYAYGPSKFSGLPGLVIHGIEDGNKVFQLEKITSDISIQMDDFALIEAKEMNIQTIAQESMKMVETVVNH